MWIVYGDGFLYRVKTLFILVSVLGLCQTIGSEYRIEECWDDS